MDKLIKLANLTNKLETMTKEFDLEELKLSVHEKMQERWEMLTSFENDDFNEIVDEALEEIDVDFGDDYDAYGELCSVIREHWKDPFFVLPIDQCKDQYEIDPTPEQHKQAVDGADYLNSMFASGCYVAQFVLEEYLKEQNVEEEKVELVVTLVGL